MATRSLNSQSEYLQKIAQLIAEAKFAPDADLQFWINLETEVLTKAHEGTGPTPASGQLAGNDVEMGAADMGAGAALMGAGMGAMGGGAAPGGVAGAPGPGGPAPSYAGVRFSPDTLRNAMRGGGVQGG